MNKKIIKPLIIATICVFIIGAVAVYFIWQTDEVNKAFDSLRNTFISTKNELENTNEELQKEIEKSNALSKKIEDMNEKFEVAIITINDLKNEEYRLVYLGDYKITHYCCEEYEHICGTGNGITATGTEVTAGRTIAVDPSIIPYGTTVYIEGYGFRVAEDCGGAVNGNHIDVAVDTHENAMSMGTKTMGVWVFVKK